MLNPIGNHASVYVLGAFRISPSTSLCVLANEPPLYIPRRKLSIQYFSSYPCPLITPHMTLSLTVNSKTSFTVNQTKFLLWVFVFKQTSEPLVLQKSLPYNILTLLLLEMCYHYKVFLDYTLMALVWRIV